MSERAQRGAGGRSAKAPDRLAEDRRNAMAFATLMCGVASWVPLVIMITGPLTVAFFIASFWTARRRGARRGLNAAWAGLFLLVLSAGIQLAFLAFTALIGWLGP